MDSSLSGSSVHGIFQAKVLEWGAIAFSILITRCLHLHLIYFSFPQIYTMKIRVTFTLHLINCFYIALMAPHSSTLAWKIHGWRSLVGCSPWGLGRVGHDWATSLSLFTFMHWRREWQPTPVFLPGEPQGQRSLVGCRLWGRTESDTTEVT